MSKRHGLKIKRINDTMILINNDCVKLYQTGGLRPKCFYNDYVIKFNDTEENCGYDQSSNEIEIWKRIKKQHKKYFATLLGWNSKEGYVIQKRITFKKGRRTTMAKKIIMEMEDYYNIEDLSYDNLNDNWGVCENGIPVIYDWGV